MTTSARCLHNASHADVEAQLDGGGFFWLDLEDPSDERMQKLGEQLQLHPLTVEDLKDFGQRPKVDDFPGYVTLIVHGADPATDAGGPLLREVHMIVCGEYVVTIHRRPIDALTELRRRYDDQPARSEQFLIYKILDTLTSTFLPVLDRLDDEIDNIEDEILANPNQGCLQKIFAMKQDLVALRRVVTPLRDVFARNIERISDLPGLENDDGRLYFRDLYDTVIHIGDMVDSYRDLLSGATDLYLSTIANRQGEINKQLTIIATIFLPLTFITGFFGQNFSALTGHLLTHTWAFWWLGIGLEVVAVIALVILFRTRKWL